MCGLDSNQYSLMVFKRTMSDSGLVTTLRSLLCLTLVAGGLAFAFGASPAQNDDDPPAEEAPAPPEPESENPAMPDAPVETEDTPRPEAPEESGEPTGPKENGPAAAPAPKAEEKPLQAEGNSLPNPAPAQPAPAQPAPAQPAAVQPAPVQPDVTPAATAGPAQDSPYQSIVRRNAFDLKEPPAPAAVPEQPAQQLSPSALKLSGIITLLGGRHATFVLQEPGKPQINSDLVAEGDKDWLITNLHVLQIDERAGMVRVAYAGKEMTLDFVNNGLKPPVAPAAATGAATGAGPGRPGQPQPGATTPAAAAARAAWTRPGAGGAASSIAPVGSPTLTTPNPSGLQSIPVRPTRLSSGAVSGINAGTQFGGGGESVQPPQPALAPEQQMLLMRAQEEISRRQGVPFPPSPPIPGLNPPPTPGAE